MAVPLLYGSDSQGIKIYIYAEVFEFDTSYVRKYASVTRPDIAIRDFK